jgi:hypothetical protein
MTCGDWGERRTDPVRLKQAGDVGEEGEDMDQVMTSLDSIIAESFSSLDAEEEGAGEAIPLQDFEGDQEAVAMQ